MSSTTSSVHGGKVFGKQPLNWFTSDNHHDNHNHHDNQQHDDQQPGNSGSCVLGNRPSSSPDNQSDEEKPETYIYDTNIKVDEPKQQNKSLIDILKTAGFRRGIPGSSPANESQQAGTSNDAAVHNNEANVVSFVVC